MEIELPDAVEEIITRLNDHGYEASAVGGCVRDSLLGTEAGRLGYYHFGPSGAGKEDFSTHH